MRLFYENYIKKHFSFVISAISQKSYVAFYFIIYFCFCTILQLKYFLFQFAHLKAQNIQKIKVTC